VSVIRRVEAFLHRSPLDSPRTHGSGITRALEHVVVRITDSEGAVGYGEGTAIPAALETLESFGRELLGTDPLAREAHLNPLRWWFNSAFALSALSIALDDLVARRLGVSIAALYGGPFRARVQPYAASYGAVAGDTLTAWIDEAEALIARGFVAMKLRLGVLPVGEECRALERFRARIPAPIALMGDGNGGFNATSARVMGGCAQELGLLWFEEPLPIEDYVGYPELAADLAIPLAGGEISFTRPATLELLRRGAVDIIQPDPVNCGGIGEVLFKAGLARLHGRLCIPHTSGGAIGVAAGLQALACLPDQSLLGANELLYLEYPAIDDPLQRQIAPNLLAPTDGWISVPTTLGLGIEIDGEAVERLAAAKVVVE
jgi:D-galactarolactone cycloisomerase